MSRRLPSLTALAVLAALLMVPATAFAGDSTSVADIMKEHGLVVAIGACFVFGIVASLTPCVFPMVPITVSIFGAGTQSQSRLRGAALSGTFVLGIAALFTPMGVVSAMSGKLMGSALSNVYVVIALALLFTALAASMFGAFELALPSSMTNKLSTVGGVGYKGAFVMGLVMGLIAAPCTGPFLTGIVTWIATTRDIATGSACMFAFALGLGVVFFVAGTFAVALPKGGAWMMGIKWASGVGLSYMAFSYLRDQFGAVHALVAHPSASFGIVALVLTLVGLGLGVVHVIAERRRSPIAHLSKRMKLASIVPAIVGVAALVSWVNLPRAEIHWLTDEAAARQQAAAEGKPVLLDFGASWCEGCKDFERKTFPDPAVRSEAARFVPIHVDASHDDDPETVRLSEKYKVVGLPTIIMLDTNGNEIVRLHEFMKPDDFLTELRKVKSNGPVASK